MTGDINRLTDNAWISSKTVRPEVVTENDDRKIFLFAVKASAKGHLNFVDIEVIELCQCAPDAHRLRGAADRGWHGWIKCSKTGKWPRLITQIVKERPGQVVPTAVPVPGGEQAHQRGGFSRCGGTQEECADDAKD